MTRRTQPEEQVGLTWLFEHRAETHPQHADARLRTLGWKAGVSDALEAVRRRMAALPRWRIVYDAPATGRIYAERRARLGKIVDEVTVVVRAPRENRAEIDVISRSRAGVGDFGRNARNIRELLEDLQPLDRPLPGAFSGELGV